MSTIAHERFSLEALREAVDRGEERDRTGIVAMLSILELDAGNLLVAQEHLAELVELGEQQDERTIRLGGLLGGGAVSAPSSATSTRPNRSPAPARSSHSSPVLEGWLAWGDRTLGLVALDRGEPAAALPSTSSASEHSGGTTPPGSWTRPSGS